MPEVLSNGTAPTASRGVPDLASRRSTPRIPALGVLEPLPPQLRLSLRGGPEALAAASAAIDLPLPEGACRAASRGDRAVLWLGPDERLLLGAESAGAELTAALEHALRALPHSLVDVSHRQAAFEVRGRHAALALAAGCPLDLHPDAFPLGMCTRTVIAKAEIVLWRNGENRFHVEVARSLTAYLVRFLEEASREFAAGGEGT